LGGLAKQDDVIDPEDLERASYQNRLPLFAARSMAALGRGLDFRQA